MLTIAPPTLAAEIAGGDCLTPPQLAHQIRAHPSTVSRWLLKGIPDGHGGWIRLEALRRGRVWFTSLAAYKRFIERHPTNESPVPRRQAASSGRAPSQRERASRDAAEQLRQRHGI